MAGHEWDWFQREKYIGRLRENVQKRTFTRWINLHLEKCNPLLEVKDLFVDIQDGKILMALLEVLSGHNGKSPGWESYGKLCTWVRG
uniref:Calponin-homology (CH) domain-containing protein n=1 Tax=Sphenodon punctatus TaxID=8508 RepID=A0A8D0LAN0_SPHPU